MRVARLVSIVPLYVLVVVHASAIGQPRADGKRGIAPTQNAVNSSAAHASSTQSASASQPVRVGDGVRAPKKIFHVPPVYPPEALSAGVEGIVVIEAVISTSGTTQSARVLRSIKLLDAAALAAVNQWRYEPTTLNGVAVPVIMTVTVNFKIDRSSPAPSTQTSPPPSQPQTGSANTKVDPWPAFVKQYRSEAEAFEGGVKLYKEGRLQDAWVSFNYVVSKFDFDHAEALLHLGKISLERGSPGAARYLLEAAMSRGKKSPHGPLSPGREAEARRLLTQAESLASRQASTDAQPIGSPSTASPGSGTTRSLGTGCQETLAHLSSRLPTIDNSELANLRSTILSTRMSDVAANMTAQGIPLAQAASLILQQAKDNQNTLDGAKACAVDSFNGSKTELASALDRRDYDVPLASGMGRSMTIREMAAGPGDSNVFRSCLRAFIAADMSKIATDETAVQLTCRAASRP